MCWLAGLSWRLAECHGRGLNPGRLRRNALRAGCPSSSVVAHSGAEQKTMRLPL